MADVQIKVSALWAALMLTYLLGDVLRIFSGDFVVGEIGSRLLLSVQRHWIAHLPFRL